MVKFLSDNHIPKVWVICIVSFITFLSGEVYLISTLVPLISAVASSTVAVVIVVKVSLRSPPGILLIPFGHTVLLEISYFVASPAPNIDASSRSGDRVLFFLLLS